MGVQSPCLPSILSRCGVEGRIQINEVNRFVLEVTPEDVEVVAVIKGAHGSLMVDSRKAACAATRLWVEGTGLRVKRQCGDAPKPPEGGTPNGATAKRRFPIRHVSGGISTSAVPEAGRR